MFPILRFFLWIPTSAANAVAVNLNSIKSIKTLLVNDVSTFFIKGKSAFSNGSKSFPRNLPDCTVLDSWVFDNFLLAHKLFAKVLQSFGTYLSVSNNLCRKLVSSSLDSPIIFDDNREVTPVPFLIADFVFYFVLFPFDIIFKKNKFIIFSRFLKKSPK